MQFGFFDLSEKYSRLSQLGDPLQKLAEIIDFESFRSLLEDSYSKQKQEGKDSKSGRKPLDRVMMFKIIILQRLYNLSDLQMEFQLTDRFSFQRFVGLSNNRNAPDEKTIWAFKEHLNNERLFDDLFCRFDKLLLEDGFHAEGGSIVDASFVEVPKQRNSREENRQIKKGETPEEFEKNTHKLSQKDLDSRWTKKNNENHYGYKNHVRIDNKHKIIREYSTTPASVHDSQQFEAVCKKVKEGEDIYADSAYRTPSIEKSIRKKKAKKKINHKGVRNKPLSKSLKTINRSYSIVRARVEHVFGFMENSMNGMGFKGIGLVRAKGNIALSNLVYNLCRYAQIKSKIAMLVG
jgi:IS5 family transposase